MTAASKMTAREAVVNYFVGEIWGQPGEKQPYSLPLPSPDANGVVQLKHEDKNLYHDADTGEPLVQGLPPAFQFGTGVLHSPETYGATRKIDDSEPDSEDVDDQLADAPAMSGSKMSSDDDDFGLTMSQKMRPSAMGLTFQANLNGDDIVRFTIKGARYTSFKVQIEKSSETLWYKRLPFELDINVSWAELSKSPNTLLSKVLPDPLTELASLQLRWRQSQGKDINGNELVSITSVLKHQGSDDKEDIFQIELEVQIVGNGYIGNPDRSRFIEKSDFEQEEIEILYSHASAFATGHGLAATWDDSDVSETMTIKKVKGTAIPIFYQELLSTNVSGISLSMKQLAEVKSGTELNSILSPLLVGYEEWIASEEAKHLGLTEVLKPAGERLVAKTRVILERMKKGLEIVCDESNENALEAFRLANLAMFEQQRSGRLGMREFNDEKNKPLKFDELVEPSSSFGFWRPFQMGFILLSLAGIVDELDEDRETVDLIFFPTGGGKTEAYLGLAAFTIAYRRLTVDEHSGADVLMRYTLRLLTLQQFERSSAMIVALEKIRRKNPKLGSAPITIGVWLGAATTPNKKEDAVALFRKKGKRDDDDANPFVLSRCPNCGAQIGFASKRDAWVGIQEDKTTKSIIFVCPDRENNCEFSRPSEALPIFITDEEVYENRPTFILATVDKFARLAWVPEARAIFNIGTNGSRGGLPPALIIQDELHLISGPLGSMVGLYEPVIQELSSYAKGDKIVRPKVVASTATTRRYKEQIRSLYGSDSVTLFPQALNRANETYFSSVERDESGKPKKGTLYIGVNPATYSDGQIAAARVAGALSQAPNVWQGDRESMDFYQTSMWFFNSLKDLGTMLTLLNSVVRDVVTGMSRYRRLPFDTLRQVWPIKELTGRIAANEVAESLNELGRKSWDQGSIRTCLASSIMEVGVDVQRLGLLTIMFQPKSTAQYIQVSGRVGRSRDEGPGLVIMLYNASRARDRSVYENFTSYHQRLYAQVEPVSSTPFAIESMKHGLVGAILSHYRSTSVLGKSSDSVDASLYDAAVAVLRQRLLRLTSDVVKIADFEKQTKAFLKKWTRYQPTKWSYSWQKERNNAPDDVDTALMRARREPIADIDDDSELVPSSLRNVDGQTQLRPVANPYQEDANE
jgi:hypothetical protein